MRGEACLQEHLFKHLNIERHKISNVSVTLIDKNDRKNILFKPEHYWQHTLKTLEPHGLNNF